jgi:sulfatase modifying factor 1
MRGVRRSISALMEVTTEQFRRFVRATKYQTDAERGVEEGGHGEGAYATTPDGERQWTASANWRNPFPNLKEYRVRDNHPVAQVSWNDAKRFVEHYGLQLPTEAQWEYAARAGSRTLFFWGDADGGGKGHGNVQDAAGRKQFQRWTSFPFDDGVVLLSAVGKYRPNAWKVHDMVGNVSEWCQDKYVTNYPGDGADEQATGETLTRPALFEEVRGWMRRTLTALRNGLDSSRKAGGIS